MALRSFEHDGFLVLRNVFEHAQVFGFREAIAAHCKHPDAGKYSGNCLLNIETLRAPALTALMETVDAQPKLRGALSEVLGPVYRRSTRNEIRVGAASPEHTDTLEWCSHGSSGYPSAGVGRYPFPTDLTGLGRNGSDYAIVTVAIYLQVNIGRACSSRTSAAAHIIDIGRRGSFRDCPFV